MKKFFLVLSIVAMVSLIAAGCAAPKPTAAPTVTVTAKPAPAPTVTTTATTTATATATTTATATATTTVTATPKPSPTVEATMAEPWRVPIEKWASMNKPADWPKYFVMAGASAANPRFPMMLGLGQILEQYAGLKPQVLPVAGFQAMRSLLDGQVDFLEIEPRAVVKAYLGQDEFKGVGLRTIRAVTNFAKAEPLGFMVRPGSGIKSVSDMRGKRIAGYWPAAPNLGESFDAILRVYGMTQKDIVPIQYGSTDEGIALLKEKRADVWFMVINPTNPYVTDLTVTGNADIIFGLDPDKVAAIYKEVPWYPPVTTPKGTFPGQDKDIINMGQPHSMPVMANAPESLVYVLTRLIWENKSKLDGFGARWTNYDSRGSLDPANFVIAYHPGAIRYYKEVGLWGEKQEAKHQEFLQATR